MPAAFSTNVGWKSLMKKELSRPSKKKSSERKLKMTCWIGLRNVMSAWMLRRSRTWPSFISPFLVHVTVSNYSGFSMHFSQIFLKDSNRYQEQVLLETLESDGDINSIWEGIAKYIDTSNDVQDPKNADVTRMRKLFIQLKNQSAEKSLSSGNTLNWFRQYY